MENTESTKEQKKIEKSVSTTMDKIIPKFCTNIDISLLQNKNLVLTMIYNENSDAALIERIIIDLEHAKSLSSVLNKLLVDIENASGKH